MAKIYKRIRQRREELGLSQDELAKKMGYKSRSSINKIEKGENDIPQAKIEAFARALDTTTAYLLGIDEEKENARTRAYDILKETIEKVARSVASSMSIEPLQEKIDSYVQLSEDDEHAWQCLCDISDALELLNAEGQQKAVERVEELMEIPKYQRKREAE